MVKLLLKLALAGLLANATWRLGSAYVQFYKFKDAVTEMAQFGGDRSAPLLRQRVLELASQYDVPLPDDALTVQRSDSNHTIVDAAYQQPIDLLPGYRYSWSFAMHVDVFTIASFR